MNSRLRPRLTRSDFLWMGVGFLCTLLLSYLLGRGRMFWEDEMLGWMLLTDPSWHHMVQAWKMGADGGGFSFYLTCRGWFSLFGPSEVSFRLYSAVCFGVAFLLCWAIARRWYARWVVGFALFNTYFGSPPLVLHLNEGRFYGLLLMSVALTLWLGLRAGEVGKAPRPYFYLAVFAAHALLVTSHLLGVVYSAFIVLLMVALDRSAGERRPRLYLSACASWLLLIPERKAIYASAAVGKPWFWTTPPTLPRFIGAYSGFSGEILGTLALLLFLLVWSHRGKGNWRSTFSEAFRGRRPAYLTACLFFLVPIAFFLEGLVGTSLFINRYLLPVLIGTCLLTAELLTLTDWRAMLSARLTHGPVAEQRLRAMAGVLLAAVLSVWIFGHVAETIMAQPDYSRQLNAMLPKGVPILMEDSWSFTEIIGRAHASGVQYLYPLDWDQAISVHAPRLEVTQYNLMHNWQKAGYFSGSIVNLKSFLAQHDRFLVLDSELPRTVPITQTPEVPFLGNPLVLRFRKTPGYRVSRYAALNRRGTVTTAWLVEHDPKTTGLPEQHGALDP